MTGGEPVLEGIGGAERAPFPRVRVVGSGRAGSALAMALRQVGVEVDGPVGRDALAGAADGVGLVVLAVPDAAIAGAASAVAPVDGTVVAHLAGSLGLDVLAPHQRRAAIHPLVALPDGAIGAERLLSGAWFALAADGDPVGSAVAEVLGGRTFSVAEADRARYHAAAVIASNHLVALLDQAAAVAPDGVPLAAYLDLVRATVENVATLGPADALTGPAARGDVGTIHRHLEALAPEERPLYELLSARCAAIAQR